MSLARMFCYLMCCCVVLLLACTPSTAGMANQHISYKNLPQLSVTDILDSLLSLIYQDNHSQKQITDGEDIDNVPPYVVHPDLSEHFSEYWEDLYKTGFDENVPDLDTISKRPFDTIGHSSSFPGLDKLSKRPFDKIGHTTNFPGLDKISKRPFDTIGHSSKFPGLDKISKRPFDTIGHSSNFPGLDKISKRPFDTIGHGSNFPGLDKMSKRPFNIINFQGLDQVTKKYLASLLNMHSSKFPQIVELSKTEDHPFKNYNHVDKAIL